MKVKQHSYDNTDKQYFEIINFLTELGKIDDNTMFESGRMNFWRHSVHGRKAKDDIFFKQNVMVFKDNDKIVGVCISEYGRNDIFLEVHPDYISIYNNMFEWVENSWAKDKEEVEIDVFSNDSQKIEVLIEHGYTFKEHTENLRYYDMDKADFDYELKEGYKIQAFYENMNYESRVEVVKSAFDNTEYSAENLKSIHSSPDYKKHLDLCVVSPDGQIAAYCIGWHDNKDKTLGYIEPVGTHKDFRRMGFASAINKECFKRLKADGIKTVTIASKAEPNVSNYLYNSLKPVLKKKVMKYSKQLK